MNVSIQSMICNIVVVARWTVEEKTVRRSKGSGTSSASERVVLVRTSIIFRDTS